MAASIESRSLIQRDESLSENSDEIDEDSHASILASVKEQEHQFAQLTKEIEKERRTVAEQLNHDSYGNDVDYNDSMNSDGYYDQQEDYISRREDFSDPHEETEVIIDEDGVAKTVTKRTVTKTVVEQRVRHIREGGSLPRNGSNGPTHGNGRDNHYGSMPRNRADNPYEDRQALLDRRPSESSSGDSDPALMKPMGYKNPPQQNNYGSSEDVRRQTPEKFQPEEYGLEDDRHSDLDDGDDQYGLEPNVHRERLRRGSDSSGASSARRFEVQIDDDVPVAAPRGAPKFGVRAPLAEEETGSRASLDQLGKGWVTLTLEEVIKMLSYNLAVVQQNAAAYLQHLCFNNDKVKEDVRKLNGIPPLVKLLDHPNTNVELNACGSLRNLCYGSKNDRNKIEIKKCEGVPAVVRLVRAAKDTDVKEQATGTLWNLSAHPELKSQVFELGLEPLNNLIIVPYAEAVSKQGGKAKDIDMVDVFTNAVGVVRNLSSTDSVENRKRLRECPELVLSLMNVLQANVDCGNVDNKATENCICVLRNLTYHLQDETANKDLFMLESDGKNSQNDQADTSCFGKSKPKGNVSDTVETVPPNDPDAMGAALLWQPDVARLYVSLLQESSKRNDVSEAALGAIMNLTNGIWKWSVYSRVVIRKEKGLPVIIDRLRTDNDQVVRAGTTALTNLAEDNKNKELIGKFAMKDLVYKLPGGSDPNVRLSDTTTIAILNTMRVLVEQNSDNVRFLRDAAGIERITVINNSRDSSRFHSRVVKAAGQLLKAIWANKDVRSQLKKDGWKKEHFVPTVTAETLPRNSATRPYEEPRSAPNAGSSTGGRRAQRKSQPDEEVPLTSPEVTTSDDSKRKGPADSWV